MKKRSLAEAIVEGFKPETKQEELKDGALTNEAVLIDEMQDEEDTEQIDEVLNQLDEGMKKEMEDSMKDMTVAEKKAYLKKKKEEGALNDEIKLKF